MIEDSASDWLIGSLARGIEPIEPTATCASVLDKLSRRDAPQLAAVVEAERPIGLVDRLRFLSTMAQPYCIELYAKRPIAAFMERDFRTLEADAPVDILDPAEAAGDTLPTGFAVTRDGRYVGIGFMIDLAKRVTERLQRRNEQLVRARQELYRANEARSDFLASVSHELRTPLNAIIGFSEAMHAGLFGPIQQPRYREYVVDIRSSADHLLSLINDLLDFRQAESGHLALAEEPLDIEAAIEAAMRVVSPAAATAGVSLRRRIDDGLPALYGDPKRVRQILLNLLSNAVKFTPSGGSVSIEAGLKDDLAVRLAVRDDGIGIAPGEIAKVLSPFGRAETSYVRSKEGTGLGLPLSKLIAERHGGTLRIESRVGAGTTVWVEFPPWRSTATPGAAAARLAAAG